VRNVKGFISREAKSYAILCPRVMQDVADSDVLSRWVIHYGAGTYITRVVRIESMDKFNFIPDLPCAARLCTIYLLLAIVCI
jgi:hypothetical protein